MAILTFGVLSVLTCFSQIYSQSQMFSLLQQTEENSNDAVMKLDELASNVQINADNIQILNRTVEMLKISLRNSIATLTDVQAGMAFHVLINSLDSKLTHITNGLALLSQHKLSPLLIRPLYLVKPLQKLQTQLLKRNIILSLDNVFELFSLDVSHSMLVNGTLLVYIHVPCYHPGQLMDLHELHPVPVKLPTLPPSYVLPCSANRFLAISQSELEFQSFSAMDLTACRSINDISFCNHNIIRRDSDNDCLMALFKQDTRLIGTVDISCCLLYTSDAADE